LAAHRAANVGYRRGTDTDVDCIGVISDGDWVVERASNCDVSLAALVFLSFSWSIVRVKV
jgi:hypothetical protein